MRMRVYLLVVAIASRLVPPHRRGEWRREWDAELRHYELAKVHLGQGALHRRLLVRSLGAIRDAALLALAGAARRLIDGPVDHPGSPADQMLVGIPAAALTWCTMMLVTAIGGLVFGLYLARSGSDSVGGGLAVIWPALAAIPFGVVCVGVYWPAVAALMAMTRGRISRAWLAIFGALLVYPAGILLLSVGHLVWGRGTLLAFLKKVTFAPPVILPHFWALVIGGAVFGAFYWRFARDKAQARAAEAGSANS
jgi:hypothetical protein